VGLDATGTLCAQALRGAVRLEHQLTGGAMVVPEGGEIIAAGSDLERVASEKDVCGCAALAHNYEPPAPPTPKVAIAALAEPDRKDEPEKREEPPKPRVEEPAWKVMMPPLVFDASAPPPPLEPRPETILLVREVRVRYGTVFTGQVIPRAPNTKPADSAAPVVAGSAPGPAPASAAPAKEEKRGNPIARFFRRLFGGKGG
jgi:hypothetical protein